MGGYKFSKSMSTLYIQAKGSEGTYPKSDDGSTGSSVKGVSGCDSSLGRGEGETGKASDMRLFEVKPLSADIGGFNVVGINPTRPEIISCFDFLPMYTQNASYEIGDKKAGVSDRLRGRIPMNLIVGGSGSPDQTDIFPTKIAELADLQVQAQNLKIDAFKNELAELTGVGGSLFWQRVYDQTQLNTAANVIRYYTIMYRAMSTMADVVDLKRYNLRPVARATEAEDPSFGAVKYFMPSEYQVYNPRGIARSPGGGRLSYFFSEYLKYDKGIFNSFSNTRIFLQMITDLKSIIACASPELLDNPETALRRGLNDIDTRNPIGAPPDQNIRKAWFDTTEALKNMVINLANVSSFRAYLSPVVPAPDMSAISDFGPGDYAQFIANIPSDPVKRIAFLSHVVNRDLVIRSNMSVMQAPGAPDPSGNYPTGNTMFHGGYYGAPPQFPADTSRANFANMQAEADFSDAPSIDSFRAGIENILFHAFGASEYTAMNAERGKFGLSALASLKSTRDLASHGTTDLTKLVLPFESTQSKQDDIKYQTGLEFFFKNLADSDSSLSHLEYVESIRGSAEEYLVGGDFALKQKALGLNRMLYGAGDGVPTKNFYFYQCLMWFLQDVLRNGYAGYTIGPYGATHLAMFSLADDLEIGYKLTRFMANYVKWRESPVSYSMTPYQGTSGDTGPVDALGDVPDSASSPLTVNFKFYANNVEEYIRDFAEGGGEDLINSMEDLANALHDKTSEMSSDVEYPASATSHTERHGGFNSFFMNTFTDVMFTGSDPTSSVYGLSSGWGAALMYTLQHDDHIFHRIVDALNFFEDMVVGGARVGEGSSGFPSPESFKGTFNFERIHRTTIAVEIVRQTIESFIPVKIANTGYDEVRQNNNSTTNIRAEQINENSGGVVVIPPESGAMFSLNKLRIDVYESHMDAFIDAVDSLPTPSGGGVVSGDPPGATSSDTESSSYASEIKRDVSDVFKRLAEEDAIITDFAYIFKSISEGFSHARSTLDHAYETMLHGMMNLYSNDAALRPNALDVDLDFNISDVAARSLFKQISADTENATLSTLNPEQIQTMTATWYRLSNSHDTNTIFPMAKCFGAGALDLVRAGMKTIPMLSDPGKRRKILTVGIPNGLIDKLRRDLKFDIERYETLFDESRGGLYTDSLSDADASLGIMSSGILSTNTLIKVKVYKRNLKNDSVAYKPKTFLYDPGLFLLPNQPARMVTMFYNTETGDMSAPPPPAEQVANPMTTAVYTKISITSTPHGTFSKETSGRLLYGDVASEWAKRAYPWAATVGNTNPDSNELYSEAAVGGSEVARQMINALATNHLVDFMLGQYLKLVANIETSEDIFQINGTGFGSFPDPLTTDIYTAFIGSIENRIPISSADASRKIDYLKRMCEISYPFANENYRDRCINSTSFDRVFNLIIDEDSFESYTLKPGYYEASVSEESSGEIGTAIGPTSTFSFTPGSGLIPQRSSNTELEASYSDYYITVEVVQPIRSDPLAPSIGYSDSSVSPGYDAGDETPGEDALDGGLFEKGPQKDKEILTPPEMNLEQKGLGGGPMADIEDAAIQQGIDDMMEKIQPWLDDMTSGNMGAIKDMFERSVVCPKGLPGSEETDDIINNMRNFGAETLENLLGDFLNNGAGLTGTDILMNVQDSVLNVLGAEGSIVDGIFDPRAGLTDVTGDIGSTLDINPAENLADTGMSSASDMLRGLTTQIDSIADGLMSGVPGIDAGILENDLAQGMTGLGASMDASVNLSAGATAAGVAGVESAVTQDYFGIDSNLSAKELSYGVSMEMMNSAQGLSNIGNAISSGVNAGEMMLGMDMFQLHGVNSYNNFQMVF